MVLLELAEIVLYAVVECANRETYIPAITGLPETAQKTIMGIIQRRMRPNSNIGDDEEHSFDTQENSSPAPKAAASAGYPLSDPALRAELEALREKVRLLESGSGSPGGDSDSRRPSDDASSALVGRLPDRADNFKALVAEIETQHEEERRKWAAERLKHDEERRRWEAFERRVKDDLDLAQSAKAQVAELTRKNAMYVKKLEEFNFLKEENRSLQERIRGLTGELEGAAGEQDPGDMK